MNPIRFSKILIADDSDAFRAKVKSLLIEAKVGYYHYEARDGIEAIAQYKANKPHVTIMDIMMPNMDGIQAINEIMKINPKAKIIVASTRENKELIDATIKTGGAKDYLIKPFTSGAVVMSVSKILLENRDYKRNSSSFESIKKLKATS